MTLIEAIEPYREKETRAVALWQNPTRRTADNLILFSVTYMVLLGKDAPISERFWCYDFIKSCELKPGLLGRYPGDNDVNSWDCHWAAALFAKYFKFPELANLLFQRAVKEDWHFGNNWLGRIIAFPAVLRMCAPGTRMGPFSRLAIILPLIANMFEKRQETSGKCLLYMMQKVLYGQDAWIDAAINFWRWRMTSLYGTPKELYRIFFGHHDPNHPFIRYAPDTFYEEPSSGA